MGRMHNHFFKDIPKNVDILHELTYVCNIP